MAGMPPGQLTRFVDVYSLLLPDFHELQHVCVDEWYLCVHALATAALRYKIEIHTLASKPAIDKISTFLWVNLIFETCPLCPCICANPAK